MKDRIVPVLRIFDEAKAREFYCDFLGMRIDWVHQFGDNFPKYFQVSRGSILLHLSEHHGDACPGAKVRIYVGDVGSLEAELRAKDYKYAKPSAEVMPWKTKDMGIDDPFGNQLVFVETL